MAQTFIGRLIMGYRDEAGPGAKKTAAQVNAAIRSIESAGQRLARAPWGVGFQKQIDRLGLTPAQVSQITGSWNTLHQRIRDANLNKALARSEISGWKAATISHFAQVRAAADQNFRSIERSARRHRQIMQQALRPAYVALGGYTGAYMGGLALREAFTAGSERRREVFRQDMSSLSDADKAKIDTSSTDLSQRYKSLSKTDVMEMARVARNLMGDTERGLGVLERMTQGLVTLQSTKGGEVAIREMTGLLRGLDNLGVNKQGAEGVRLVNEMIEAMVRASQIEGQDFDAGTFFQFARRSKVAGPALSPEFLAIAPTIMQDMGPDSAGNALAMAFKAFVLEAVGSAGGKKYLAERDRLGLRKDGGVVDAALFGRNPIEWTRKYLVPALEKDGVDMSDETAIAKAVGKLSGNTNATGMLTRFITQAEQIDRLIRLYNDSMGIEAADRAGLEDPFVAYRGFIQSLRDLSAEIMPMDAIARGLDGMSGAIKRFADQIASNPDMKAVIGIGAGAAAGGAAFMAGRAVYGLITAGTNLNVAAVALQRAAAMQAGGGALDGIGGGRKKGRGVLGAMGWAAAGFFGAYEIQKMIDANNAADAQETVDVITGKKEGQRGHFKSPNGGNWMDAWANGDATWVPSSGEQPETGGLPIPRARPLPVPASRPIAEEIAASVVSRLQLPPHAGGGAATPSGPFGGADGLGVPTSPFDASRAEAEAAQAGARIEQALSVTGQANLDTSQADSALNSLIGKAQQLLNLLQSAGREGNAAKARVNAEVNRTFADFGGP